jgi:RNA-directed DNA polymerase
MVRDPKQRLIAVASIRDRIIHRLLYEELVKGFDHMFLFDVWSCRKEKGLHGAIDRTAQFLHSFPKSFVWRADIAKFFESIDHNVLRACLYRRIHDERMWYLLDQVIDSYSPGIPIGNLTSQIFSNIILHELDRFVVHTVKPLRYLRYGDDVLVFVANQEIAHHVRGHVVMFLKDALKLQVHAHNDVIVSASQGLLFCGYELFSTGRRLKRATVPRVLKRVRYGNIGSYHGLIRSERNAKSLRLFHWRIAAKMRDISC